MAEKRRTGEGGRGRYEGDRGGDDAKPDRLPKIQRRGEGGTSKEKKRRGILYFQTHMYFYKIDLDQFDGSDSEVKSLVPSVDFVESDRFIGMGLCKIRERVFMFGGQTPIREDAVMTMSPLDLTSYNEGVTEFVPHEDKFVDQDLIPQMTVPKARPLVVSYEDEIFVHDRYPVAFRGRGLYNSCLFQRLRLSSGSSSGSSWETLDSPISMGVFTGLRTSLLGERLFLLDPVKDQVFCFNLKTLRWEPDSSYSMLNSCNKKGLQAPIGGTRVFRLRSGANILLFVSQDQTGFLLSEYSTAEGLPYRLHAYVLDESSGGQLLAFQSLPQFDPFIRSLLFERAAPIFLDLKDGSWCGLFFGRNRITRRGHYLNVCIFSMEKSVADEAVDRWRKKPLLNSKEETEILRCKIRHSQFFELSGSEKAYLLQGGHETLRAFIA